MLGVLPFVEDLDLSASAVRATSGTLPQRNICTPPCLTRLDAPDCRYSTNLFPISHISKMHFSYPARCISYVLSFLPFLPATAISDFFCIYGRGRAKLVLVWKYFRFLFSNSHPLTKGKFTVIYQNALCKNTFVQLGSNLFDKINSLLTEVQCNGWMVA